MSIQSCKVQARTVHNYKAHFNHFLHLFLCRWKSGFRTKDLKLRRSWRMESFLQSIAQVPVIPWLAILRSHLWFGNLKGLQDLSVITHMCIPILRPPTTPLHPLTWKTPVSGTQQATPSTPTYKTTVPYNIH